mmetsp:Transcript_72017/g.198737  ORF Transcript_72017/g.198737 Transcript_72017/m.198737 type:complete len:223 (-) Transcript_72017:93-761(-)
MIFPILAVAVDVVELVKGLQPAYVVELMILSLHGLIHYGVVRLEVWRPSLHPREGHLAEALSSVSRDLLDVDIPDKVFVHVDSPAEVLLAREERVGLVGLESPVVEPLRILQLWQALVDGEAAVIVLHLLDFVVKTRPDVALLLVTTLARKSVDVISPHTILVLINVHCRFGFHLRRVDQVLQSMLTAHCLLCVLALVHEDHTHGLLNVLDVLMGRAQLLQN